MIVNPFSIVKDSSIWQTNTAYSGIKNKDPYLRIGIVKRAYRDEKTQDVRYLVEIQDRNDSIELSAKYLRSFGGVFNYEDVIYRGYKITDKPDPTRSFDAKAGDVVLVGFLNGESREAIIIGSLTHPARTPSLDPKKGPQYLSEFNGIETRINESGEYKLTFKALPKNIKTLDNEPKNKLSKPEYDTKIGGSYIYLDKTGSIELNDKDKETQMFRIDKAKGTTTIVSGKISLVMTKSKESVDLKCKLLNVSSADKINIKTKESTIESSKSIKIKSDKVAIGKNGIELLDQIFQLIDALSKVAPISPVGPCTPLISTPQWSQVVTIQNKIKQITGSL